MEELYFVRRKRGNYKTLRLEFGEVKNKFLLRFIEGEINPELKSESYPVKNILLWWTRDVKEGIEIEGTIVWGKVNVKN